MPGQNTNWLQGQDSNLRYRGYEPRGLDRTCPPCQKKARRTVKVRQPGARWRGETQSARAGTSSCSLLGGDQNFSQSITGKKIFWPQIGSNLLRIMKQLPLILCRNDTVHTAGIRRFHPSIDARNVLPYEA